VKYRIDTVMVNRFASRLRIAFSPSIFAPIAAIAKEQKGGEPPP